ncbi:MAG: hypothetical protein KFB95_00980 [Simkaniaceae bacterium]|nr:MAG: hypothetical protein KFB95_00980 [Simkaniaceae bacterium]
MTEQLNRHPHRRVEPHPLDGTLAMAGKLITAPIRGLHYIEKALTGTYTADQDFFSRYQWTKHHVEDLHKSLSSPNFWVKWSRQGNATYIEIQDQLSTLHREREKARAIYARQRHCRYPRDLSTRNIACTALAPLKAKLRDIHLRTTKASGQSYIDKKQQDATEIQSSIASLKNTPIESSWETWLLKHQTPCQAIESNILSLNHTTYLYVSEGREKLQGINTQDLNTLLYNVLVDVALKHYKTHVSHEYRTLYEEVKAQLESLKNRKTAYHSSWGNYFWSYWETNCSAEKHRLDTQLHALKRLYVGYMQTALPRNEPALMSPQALQNDYLSLFPSQKGLGADRPSLGHYWPVLPFPDDWKDSRHLGVHIKSKASQITSVLQLVFSDPILAKHVVEGAGQIEELRDFYGDYLKTGWSIPWDALQAMSPIQRQGITSKNAFKQFFHDYKHRCLQTPLCLHLSHGLFSAMRSIGVETSQSSFEVFEALLSPLNKENNSLFHTIVIQNIAEGVEVRRERQAILHLEHPLEDAPDTLEMLLEKQFKTSNGEAKKFLSPPELLIVNLTRTEEQQNSPIGLQEEFFLLPTHTTSRKGAAYELISFTSSDTHYRKTPFGYTRISNTLEEITQLDFLIAAQTASTCVLRRSDTNIPELELFQRAQQNRLHFSTLQFKISAIHAIYGQSTFKIPAPHQTTFQHLVDFIQCVAKTSSLPERMFGKNPNDDLERTFQKLPKTLQTFLLNTLHAPNKNPALLRDLRTHLLTSEETLSIPPIAGQQQHDVDRFVLTLIADRLVKHFASHTESILKNEDQLFLLQATLHAVSQNVQAKRKRVIRYSAAAEETIQLTVTLVFSNYLEKGEEFLIRQAISSGTRLITVMGDPLQESRLFQTAMRTTTAIILLGQSLDNPELSDQDVTNTIRQFFARQGIALISLESVPQPVQDLAIATLSTAIFRSPSHLINWGVSTTFTLINTALIDDLPPDVPQSNLNFYRARILNPLLTNAALQAFTAEKVTQAGLRLLRSLEDSDHTTEDLTPTIPIEEAIAEAPLETQTEIDQLPKPELVHNEYYVDTRHSFRVYDNPRLEGDDYGKFNSQEEAQKFIRELKSVEVSDNNRKLVLYNLKVKALRLGISPEKLPADPHFTKIRLALEVTSDSVKLYKGPQRVFKVSNGTEKKPSKRFDKGMTEAKKHVHTHNVNNDKLLQTFESGIQALFPAHIMAPEPIQKAFPIIKHTNTVCTLTPAGEVADRVTFHTRDQSESIRSFHATHEVDLHQCQTTRFEMEKQAVQQGVPIESLPSCSPFVQTQLQVEVHGSRHFSLRVNGKTAHTFTGAKAFTQLDDKLSQYRTSDRGANQRTLNQHQTQLSSLTNTPITQTKPTPSERSRLIGEMLPPVKTEKEHGAWFRGWRSAKATGSKGVQWLRDIGLAGASVDVAQTGINAPKPTNSTPSYAGAYGPDVARTPSTPAPLQAHSAATPSPVENWGWQDVEEMQQHKVLDALENAINTNRQTFSGMPQAPIDYQTLWGEGVGPEVQFPPTTFDGAQLNSAATKPPQDRPLQMAGFAPLAGSQASARLLQGVVSLFLPDMSDMPGAENPMDHVNRLITAESVDNFAKSIPKGTANILIAGVSLMLPDMSDVPGAEDPRTHLKIVTKNAFLKYDNIMQIDPHAFSAKAGEFVGEMFAFGGLGKVIRVAEGISVLGMACEGGMVGLVVSEAHDTNKVAGVAFGFIGGAAFGRLSSRAQNPLADRVFIRPQGYSRELRFLRSVNQPAYRSGIGNPMNEMVAVQPKLLVDRNVKVIKQIKNFLGKESRAFYNEAGDIVIESKDGLRQFRVDMLSTKPHKNPHSHVIRYRTEKNKKGKLDNKRVFPKDVKPE